MGDQSCPRRRQEPTRQSKCKLLSSWRSPIPGNCFTTGVDDNDAEDDSDVADGVEGVNNDDVADVDEWVNDDDDKVLVDDDDTSLLYHFSCFSHRLVSIKNERVGISNRNFR